MDTLNNVLNQPNQSLRICLRPHEGKLSMALN